MGFAIGDKLQVPQGAVLVNTEVTAYGANRDEICTVKAFDTDHDGQADLYERSWVFPFGERFYATEQFRTDSPCRVIAAASAPPDTGIINSISTFTWNANDTGTQSVSYKLSDGLIHHYNEAVSRGLASGLNLESWQFADEGYAVP